MSVNTVYLLGRVGKDPEVRTVGSANSKVAQFSLCTGGKYTTKDGREVDDTAWHNIVAWRSLAETAEKYIKKGTQVFVQGHLSYRKWTDDKGVDRFVTDIVADKIELCGGKPEGTASTAPRPTAQPQAQTVAQQLAPSDDGDLPF